MTPTILTATGKYFNFLQPSHSPIKIEDIAHALSHINRFGGHTRWPYSVAQHSVYVSHLVPQQDMLAGLLHDAHEAYIGDIPSPLKHLLPDYRDLETRIEIAVRHRFMIPHAMPASVKQADLTMLATEDHYLMPPHDDQWPITQGISRAPWGIGIWGPDKAKEEFLHRYWKLTRNMYYDEVPV